MQSSERLAKTPRGVGKRGMSLSHHFKGVNFPCLGFHSVRHEKAEFEGHYDDDRDPCRAAEP